MGVFHYELEGTQRLYTSASGLLWGVRETSRTNPPVSSVSEIASSPPLYYAFMLCVPLTMTALFYKQWN